MVLNAGNVEHSYYIGHSDVCSLHVCECARVEVNFMPAGTNLYRLIFENLFQMPQHKLIYRSILLSTVLLSMILRLAHANPILYDDMEEKSRDKRSFYDIQCKGIYDKTIFARVDQICEDCYNIFREPKLHTLCR